MYMKLGFLDSALKVFDEIFGEFEVRPDSVTVSSLFSGCGGDVKVGGLVHCWGVKIGVEECDCDDDVEFLSEYSVLEVSVVVMEETAIVSGDGIYDQRFLLLFLEEKKCFEDKDERVC
ncbi:hypothetical protein Tco_1025194 [Tanacetum coccineum]